MVNSFTQKADLIKTLYLNLVYEYATLYSALKFQKYLCLTFQQS